MQRTEQGLLFSASNIVGFAGCRHSTHLDLLDLVSPMPRAPDSDDVKLLQEKGLEHEQRYLERLTQQIGAVTDLKDEHASNATRRAATLAAMQRGDRALFQATFLAPPWVGHPDFLLRVDAPSRLGAYAYEVADTKVARSSHARFLLQLCLYSDLLAGIQGQLPLRMQVVLGDERVESFHTPDYLYYHRHVARRFLQWTALAERQSYPEQCDRCPLCHWRDRCKNQWEADDHPNRVAGITRLQIMRLREAGVLTMGALAELPDTAVVPKIAGDTLRRLAHQARLQRESLRTGEPVHELLPLVPGKGFYRLPEPAEGDVFFDMEGDPHEEGGLEYLFGLYYLDGKQPTFKPFWAHDRTGEKRAFEAFVDFVDAHLTHHPGAHVYHYASYERTALRRLMSLHGTREASVDTWLRDGILVDLYSVVRDAIRVGESSYSIKAIERFYARAPRQGDVTNAGASIIFYEHWKQTHESRLLEEIAKYNEDDVRSTYELRDWLLRIRPAEVEWLRTVEAASPSEAAPRDGVREKSEAALDAEKRLEDYRRALVGTIPEDPAARSDEDRVRMLLFDLLSLHRRCDKPVWWGLFDRLERSQEELIDDYECLGGLELAEPPVQQANTLHYRYRYPPQETKLESGDRATALVPSLKLLASVTIDEHRCEVQFAAREQFPKASFAIGPAQPIPTKEIKRALERFVDRYLAADGSHPATLALLRRDLPNVAGIVPGQPLLPPGRDVVTGTIDIVSRLRDSYLFIQGPPGAGKTYTGSQVIVALIRAGKRVGVASNSHKAINNLLEAVERTARAAGVSFRGAKKSSGEDTWCRCDMIADYDKNPEFLPLLREFQLLAGTAWFFCNEALDRQLDYLFVDEAGQVSLANLVAMSVAARNLVLLGDQMQLGQPIQGVHPGESGKSSLEYLLQGQATIAPERGIFLPDTWRMNPDVCAFISDAVYDGRLRARAENAKQRLMLGDGAHPALSPMGVRFIPIEHDGCSQRSDEEASLVVEVFESLLGQHYVDRKGARHPVTIGDILVVAPYNLQVNLLQRRLPGGARVGTVDKFQGQEAQVVLVSMTTSSGDYLPRDIEFLYSRNRLNVAVSRARCLSLVIASPKLLDVDCSTPEQMKLVNTLCWLEEYGARFAKAGS